MADNYGYTNNGERVDPSALIGWTGRSGPVLLVLGGSPVEPSFAFGEATIPNIPRPENTVFTVKGQTE